MHHAGDYPQHNTAAERERVRLEGEVHRLRIENRALRDHLEAIDAVLGAVGSTPTDAQIIELLGRLLGTTIEAADARDGSLLVVDDDHDELVFIVVRGAVPEDVLKWRRLPVGHGVAGWVAANREAVIVNDPGTDPRFSALIDEELDFETRSILAVPVERDERVLGVMEAINKNGGRDFTGDDAALVLLAARLAAELLELMERQAKPPPRARAGTAKKPRARRKTKKKSARAKATARGQRAPRKKRAAPGGAPSDPPPDQES